VSKNGAPAGNLQTLQINDQGLLQAIYDTGQVRSLFRIPVVNVPNPNGLTALDGQAFTPSPESGGIFLWDANTGPIGSVAGFSLQQSTVDIARELTDLIQTQRAYSSNATTIRTVDEMLQETTNLKR
jgi:flagellar hook protein FlgE